MEDLLKTISEIISQLLGKKNIVVTERLLYISLLLIVFVIYPVSKYFLKTIYLRARQYLRFKNLNPYFDYIEVGNATRHFIQTEFQNVDPANEIDYTSNESYAAREKLIPFFINKSFKKVSDKKYFLILADSGMGKTTLLINLYFHYLSWFNPNKKIRLFPLGKKYIERDVELIPFDERKNTILLLDGFDEDQKAIENYENRMKEILEFTIDFKKIIISSRTHFFKNVDEEPYETGLMKFGGEKGGHFFHKVYISPFNDKKASKNI